MLSLKRLRPLALTLVGLAVVVLAVWFFRPVSPAPADVDALEAGVQPLRLTAARLGPNAASASGVMKLLQVLDGMYRTTPATEAELGPKPN